MKRMWTEREVRSLAVDSVEKKTDLKVFENIVDKDGHKRFIEGDITAETISGVTQTYGKWSLSGTHLMIVLGLTIADAITLNNGDVLAVVNLPEWVVSKLSVLFANRIDSKQFLAFGANYSSQVFNVSLNKIAPGNDTKIIKIDNLTLTAERNVRIQLDFLIDTD